MGAGLHRLPVRDSRVALAIAAVRLRGPPALHLRRVLLMMGEVLSWAVIGALCLAIAVVVAVWLDYLCGDEDQP